MTHKKILILIPFYIIAMKFLFPTVIQAKTSPLPAPVKVRAKSCQEKRLKLTWKKVEGASGYQIYQ